MANNLLQLLLNTKQIPVQIRLPLLKVSKTTTVCHDSMEVYLTEEEVVCPFCGEAFTVLVDCSVDQQSYVEDCFVCCHPIQFEVHCADGELLSINLRR